MATDFSNKSYIGAEVKRPGNAAEGHYVAMFLNVGTRHVASYTKDELEARSNEIDVRSPEAKMLTQTINILNDLEDKSPARLHETSPTRGNVLQARAGARPEA